MALYFESPQDLGRTLDNGFAIYRASIKPLLPLSLLTAVVVNMPSIVNYGLVGFGSAPTGPLRAATSGLSLIGFLIYMAGYVGLVISQDAVARGTAVPTVGEAFGLGFGRLGRVVLMILAFMLLLAVGFALLVVPGVILSVSLGFGIYLIALDGLGPLEALQRSHKLVWGHWWRTTVVITVAVLLYLLPYSLFFGLGAFLASFGQGISGGESPEEVVASFTLLIVVFDIVLGALLIPLMNGFMLAQLNDLKLRKSGADLLSRAPA